MFGVDAVEHLPRMEHGAILRIVEGELAVELAVPAALVAVVPEKNARVVHVAFDHGAHEAAAHVGVVRRGASR